MSAPKKPAPKKPTNVKGQPTTPRVKAKKVARVTVKKPLPAPPEG